MNLEQVKGTESTQTSRDYKKMFQAELWADLVVNIWAVANV
jgi:hypothetical protein